MPVYKLIEVDGWRLRTIINTNEKMAICLDSVDDPSIGGVIEVDIDEMKEHILRCKQVLKEYQNGEAIR